MVSCLFLPQCAAIFPSPPRSPPLRYASVFFGVRARFAGLCDARLSFLTCAPLPQRARLCICAAALLSPLTSPFSFVSPPVSPSKCAHAKHLSLLRSSPQYVLPPTARRRGKASSWLETQFCAPRHSTYIDASTAGEEVRRIDVAAGATKASRDENKIQQSVAREASFGVRVHLCMQRPLSLSFGSFFLSSPPLPRSPPSLSLWGALVACLHPSLLFPVSRCHLIPLLLRSTETQRRTVKRSPTHP